MTQVQWRLQSFPFRETNPAEVSEEDDPFQRFRDEPKAPGYSNRCLNWIRMSRNVEMSKQTDYLNFSLCFMAHNINPTHAEDFPSYLPVTTKRGI